MEKEKNNSVANFILGLKSMSLASGMMVLGAICDSIKKEWPEFNRLEEAYAKFDNSIEKALENKSGLTPTIVKYGKVFINELNSFKTLPEAQKESIQESIKRIGKNSKAIITIGDE